MYISYLSLLPYMGVFNHFLHKKSQNWYMNESRISNYLLWFPEVAWYFPWQPRSFGFAGTKDKRSISTQRVMSALFCYLLPPFFVRFLYSLLYFCSWSSLFPLGVICILILTSANLLANLRFHWTPFQLATLYWEVLIHCIKSLHLKNTDARMQLQHDDMIFVKD